MRTSPSQRLRRLRRQHALAEQLDRLAVYCATSGVACWPSFYYAAEPLLPEVRQEMQQEMAARRAVRALEYYVAAQESESHAHGARRAP